MLDAIGYQPDEWLSVCRTPPGGKFAGVPRPLGEVPAAAEALGQTVNVWFGVNPTFARGEHGERGAAAEVTRLAAVFADLDVKIGACANLDVAEAIVDGVSAAIGQRPTVVVYSGHGLQPMWRIDDGHIGETFTTADATALLRRFGRLVAVVAAENGAAVDSVFDLARVLRVPGTTNLKSVPVPTGGRIDAGGPLTVAEVDERLTELGIDRVSDDDHSTETLSDPGEWRFADQTCGYVGRIVDGLANDGPSPGGGRNPWACSQAVRLWCAVRLGCITEADFGRAVAALGARLDELLTTTEPRRRMRRYEMLDVGRLGRRRASEKTEEQARAELGRHDHLGGPEDFWGAGGAAASSMAPVLPVPTERSVGVEPYRPPWAGRLLTRSALRNLPRPEPLIEGVLDRGTCGLLYGYRGTLKSFVALDWAASVATGRPWQGRRTDQVRGLYVAAEGAHGYPGRFDAWETGWQRTIDDGALDLYPAPVNFMVPAEVAELGALVEWGGYGFVVVDTLARCTVGGDENSAKDMGMVVDRLYYLLGRTPERRGVVLAVHHTGKDQKTLRGSTALEAGVDTVYSTTRDGPVVTLDRTKRKDGPELDHHELMLDPIPGTGSCTLKASHPGENREESTGAAANLLLIFSRHFLSSGATGKDLREVAMSEGGMSQASFYRARNELLESGHLVNTGGDQRPFYVSGDR